MPITVTTNLPDASKPTLGNGVEDEISVDWTDVINYGHYDGQFRESSDTDWLTIFDTRTTVSSADSTTNWGSGSNSTVSTVSNPSEDGTSIQAVTDDTTTQGFRYASLTPGTNDDLSGATHLRFWYQTDETAGTHSLKLVDGSGTSETVSYKSQLTANEGLLVEVDLSSFTTVNLGNIDQYQWVFDGDGSGVDKTIYVDSVISGVAPMGGEATISAVIKYLEDGEEYEVRIRTETEHVTGAWSATATITTVFPSPDSLSVDNHGTTSITIGWSEYSDNEDGFRVYRKDEKDNKRDTGYGSFEVVADLAPNTTSYQDTGLNDNWDYKYYVEAYTEHSTATTGEVQQTTNLVIQDGWFLELRSDVDRVGVPYDDIDDVSIQPEVSGIGKWTVEIPESPYATNWLRSEAFLYYDQTLLMRGSFVEIRDRQSAANLSLEGVDVIDRLRRGGADVTYTNIEAYKAARDYLANYTNFSYTVHAPTTTTIESGKNVQTGSSTSELSNIFTPAADTPLEVRNNGLETLQTAFVSEGENATTENHSNRSTIADYSSGAAARVTVDGEYAEFDFTIDHRIPESAVGVVIRDNSDDLCGVSFQLNGTEIDSLPATASSITFGWHDAATGGYSATDGWTNGDLKPGTHTVRIECTGTDTSGEYYDYDVVTLVDLRFYKDVGNWDNTVDSNDALDDPGYYPDSTSIVSAVHDDTYNIANAYLNVAVNDLSNPQAIEVTNDGGSNWFGGSNTESISVDFSTVGSNIKGRVFLGGYGSQSSTPKIRANPQILDSWDLDIDTNSIRVIESQDYAGSDFRNLKQICDTGGLVFVPVYTTSGPEIEVFAEGEVQKPTPWEEFEVQDYQYVDTTKGYANRVTVYGAKDGSGGRYKATAESQSEIDRVGNVVEAPPVFDPSLESADAVENAAASEVARRVAKDTITGKLEVAPIDIQAGYAYEVPQLDNEVLTLQSAELRERSTTMTLNFEEDTDLVSTIDELDIEITRTKRAI